MTIPLRFIDSLCSYIILYRFLLRHRKRSSTVLFHGNVNFDITSHCNTFCSVTVLPFSLRFVSLSSLRFVFTGISISLFINYHSLTLSLNDNVLQKSFVSKCLIHKVSPALTVVKVYCTSPTSGVVFSSNTFFLVSLDRLTTLLYRS